MIKARLQSAAGPLFVLGIDAENVARLQDGKPIMVNLATLGGTDQVILMYGETVEAMKAELQQHFGPPLRTEGMG